MKYFTLLLLIIVVTSKRYAPAHQDNGAIDIIKCFAQKGIPFVYENYQKIIELINEKKYLELIVLVQQLVGEAKEIITECLSQTVLKIDWECFGSCLLKKGGQMVPELGELVAAILCQNWPMVAVLAVQFLFKGFSMVDDCYESC